MKRDEPTGEYRTSLVRTEDTPAFQSLSSFAQRVYYAVRMRLPLAGINTLYVYELLPRCGRDATEPRVLDARDELCHVQLLDVDTPVWWLVDVLADDPHLRWSDWKHRSAVQRRLATLPPCALLARFAQRYPAWLLDASSKECGIVLDKQIKAMLDAGADDVAVVKRLGKITKMLRDVEDPSKTLRRVFEDPSKGSSSSSFFSSVSEKEKTRRAREDDASISRCMLTHASVKAWAGDDAPRHELLARVGRHVLDAPSARRDDLTSYAHEIGAALDGMHGRLVSATQLDTALRDYATNRPLPNLRMFRRYLADAATEHAPRALTLARSRVTRTITGGE